MTRVAGVLADIKTDYSWYVDWVRQYLHRVPPWHPSRFSNNEVIKRWDLSPGIRALVDRQERDRALQATYAALGIKTFGAPGGPSL